MFNDVFGIIFFWVGLGLFLRLVKSRFSFDSWWLSLKTPMHAVWAFENRTPESMKWLKEPKTAGARLERGLVLELDPSGELMDETVFKFSPFGNFTPPNVSLHIRNSTTHETFSPSPPEQHTRGSNEGQFTHKFNSPAYGQVSLVKMDRNYSILNLSSFFPYKSPGKLLRPRSCQEGWGEGI